MARDSQKLTSLDVVRAELDSLLEQQERRGVSFDNRAGMVLGFGGVLISLSGTQPTALQLLAQVSAAVAAAFSALALWPRIGADVDPRRLRDRYLAEQLPTSKLAILDTRIDIFERDETRLQLKISQLTRSVYALGSSVLLLLLSAIVEFI